MSNVSSFQEAQAKRTRAEQLSRAYQLGVEAKNSGSSFELQWAFFVAEYGLDAEAQLQFVTGYNAA